MRIIFLDYDGVVNTLWFQEVDGEPNFNFPDMTQVNNTQAIAWLNKLYREYNYSIVVSSTWRYFNNYKEALYNAGLNKDIIILGSTPRGEFNERRGDEIQRWLDTNPQHEIEDFIILDDDSDMKHLMSHLIKTDSITGFTFHEYNKIRKRWEEKRNDTKEIKD